jgi:UDP-N-acetylglucosamine transferase subunit ALG13
MIFVTVGTHEQPFDRLIKAVDELPIDEEIVIQYGYSKYLPKRPNCVFKPFFSNELMNQYSKDARIVITHGGPGSIFTALIYGKKPIIVPRQKKFNEHVNDHQVKFSEFMQKKGKGITVLDISELYDKIKTYSDEKISYVPKTGEFVKKLQKEIDNLK